MTECEECDREHLTAYERSVAHFDLYHELIKFRLIIEDAKHPIYPEYLLEKLDRLLTKTPLTLDASKQIRFNALFSENMRLLEP